MKTSQCCPKLFDKNLGTAPLCDAIFNNMMKLKKKRTLWNFTSSSSCVFSCVNWPEQRSYRERRSGCDPDAFGDDPTASPEGPAQSPTHKHMPKQCQSVRFCNKAHLCVFAHENVWQCVCVLPSSLAVWGRCHRGEWGSGGSVNAWRSPLWWNHPDRLSLTCRPSDT